MLVEFHFSFYRSVKNQRTDGRYNDNQRTDGFGQKHVKMFVTVGGGGGAGT